MNKKLAKEEIKKLIQKYEKLSPYEIKKYNEANTRKNFIMPLFRVLGWDVFGDEVTEEEKVSKDRVDYAFRIGNIPKFFLEAKKLAVDLDETKWTKQAVDYAWNKNVSWAVLTDFEGLKIFNAEEKDPKPIQFSYKEYLTRIDDLWLLSKESFENGLLDDFAKKWGIKREKTPVGKQLAKDLTTWREELTKYFKAYREIPKEQPDEEIDEAVQRFLDRLIFIRVCEDKEIEPPTLIPLLHDWQKRGRKTELMHELSGLFRKFDKWYDSQLFEKHFSEDLDTENTPLENLIEGLYGTSDGNIKYDFSAIDADVLGNVYEQYLGTIQKRDGEKNSQRKKQGIYYTPTYIVNYIVQNTLGKALKEKSLREIKKLRILDPACGSGSFLIKVFDVLDRHMEKEFHHGVDFARKAEILINNIYGVDLDPKAVEIAQLNLLLQTTQKRTLLPKLTENIRCGNSLVSGTEKELKKYFGKNWREQKSFNWKNEFKEVFDANNNKTNPIKVYIDQGVDQKRLSKLVDRGIIEFFQTDIEQQFKKTKKQGKAFTVGVSTVGDPDMVVGDDLSELEKIIGKDNKEDSTHLYSAILNNNDYFITNDKAEFIGKNEQKRNEIEHRFNIKIRTLEEFINEVNPDPGFDVIVGNPPYIRPENVNKKERDYYLNSKEFEKTFGRFDLYILFIEKALKILNNDGYFAFIIPSSFFNQNYAKDLRAWILQEFEVQHILDLSNIKVFKTATVQSCVITIKKKKPSDIHKVLINRPKTFSEIEDKNITNYVLQNSFLKMSQNMIRTDINSKNGHIIKKVKQKSINLDDICYVVIGSVPHDSKTGASKDRLITNSKTKETHKNYLEGKDVGRYKVNWRRIYLEYRPAQMHRPKFPELFENKKLIIRNISTKEGLLATFDDKNYYTNDTVSLCVPWYLLSNVSQKNINISQKKGKNSRRFNIYYLLGLINSNLLNFYFKKVLSSNLHVYPRAIRNLPIFDLPQVKQNRIGDYAKNILDLNVELSKITVNTNKSKKLEQEIQKLDQEIDQEVYKLYKLNSEEINIIESR